jgi:hypothetical protein
MNAALSVTTARPPLAILLIGDPSHREFAGALEFTNSVAKMSHQASPQSALAHLRSAAEAPDLILLAQRWPGEFPPGELDELQRAAPLARIIGLVGAWSEGEGRSGRPWPAMTRVLASNWPAWLGQELERLARGEAPSWSLPVTTRDDERLLHASQSLPARRTGLIVVIAEREAASGAIADACRLRGYATVSLRPGAVAAAGVAGAVAAVWDTTSEQSGDAALVDRLRKSLGHIPLLALLDFPRDQHVAAARSAGVAAVMAKPYLIDDLYWQLDQLTG